MSKRKLNRRQQWRIQKIQEERAERAQKRSKNIDSRLNEGELGPEQEGLVIAHFGTQIEVENHADKSRHRCHMRANLGSLVTGDKVIWREGKPTGVIVAVMERSSELSRPDPHGQLKTVAANIDHIILVFAPLPAPHDNLINRYLVAAENMGIRPILLLNKIDLIETPEQRQAIDQLTQQYIDIGYTLIEASTKNRDGLNSLKQELKDRTSVFVGQSGVGKSSLINALLPDADIRVGALSEANDKGTHTTTTAKLFHFPDGGELIDSPGIREFGLWHMSRDEVAYGFIEFREFLGQCKFRDCKHQQEPGCAILKAVERGDIQQQRMNSFEWIVSTLEDL